MLNVLLNKRKNEVLRVLCLGCHSDDIEIGCGGTVLSLIERHPKCAFYWVVFSGSATRAREAQRSARKFLKGAHSQTVVLKEFRDSFFPYIGSEVKEFCHEISRAFNPDLVFTHSRQDLHQDHRLVAELTGNAFRDHLILEYEIPKYDGDLGRPNFFVPLSPKTSRAKVRTITDSFVSQRENAWFSEETFLSLMRIRGVECNAPGGYAEGFHARKIVF